jgi:hypothetical protein
MSIQQETEGLKQPDWVEKDFEHLINLHDYTYEVDYGTVKKSRIVSGPLLNEVIFIQYKKKIKNKNYLFR